MLVFRKISVPLDPVTRVMPAYRFILVKEAAEIEGLGALELRNDAAAIDFGKQVIRDVKYSDPVYYAGRIMKIMEGERTAATVFFDTVEMLQ
jgi:hypothetical protein